MAARGLCVSLAAILVAMLWMGASAQSSSCTSALVNLSPCLNYITGNESTPSSSCCSQLASVVQSEPQCLCTVLNGGASSLGITINQTQALALPGACKVQTPPVSQCSANGGPAGSPTSPTIPSGGGSKNVPTTGTDFSDAAIVKIPVSIMLSLLFTAAYFSTSYTIF
ncbi:non-specific lipid transfer protein GPI-anchored 15 [Elaeis guineensis]|uniref:Non-specific lipid transfer protein GPI-anchored 2 n=1 Tax=Elaeis guineensis var. tenera TaxID=51953 RepID=A0A1D5AIW3_ELAGV|nr:non-specific lipid transfer protein GPI-anchored 2 [Elaeis guineensis]AOC88990.1 type 7 nonspecific lipid transfer protein LTP701 [Elaeis guineensis]